MSERFAWFVGYGNLLHAVRYDKHLHSENVAVCGRDIRGSRTLYLQRSLAAEEAEYRGECRACKAVISGDTPEAT